MFLRLALSVLTATIPLAVVAQTPAPYRQSLSRGLHLFALGTPRAGLRLVCDSDGAYPGAKMGALFVAFLQDRAPSRVVLLGAEGQKADLTVDAAPGEILQDRTDPAQWATLLSLLSRGGPFAMVSGDDRVAFDAFPLPGLSCS